MKNLVVKYYTITDPLTAAPTKDIGYTFTKEYPDVLVKRINGVPTIVKDDIISETIEVFPEFSPYVLVNKATYDAAPITGESETVKYNRTKKLLFVEKYLIENLNPPDETPNPKTQGELQKEAMEYYDETKNGFVD